MTWPRVAITIGSLHLPGERFVIGHAAALRGVVDSRLFAYSVNDPSNECQIPVSQAAPRVTLPHHVRRRLYPVAERSMTHSVLRWKPDLVHQHFLSLGGFAGAAAARSGIPMVSTIHAVEPFLLEPPRTLRERHLRDQCQRTLERTHVFLAVSHYIQDWLTSLGVPPGRIELAYLGVDTNYWAPWAAEADGPPRLVFVGNLSRLKGVLDLIDLSREIVGSKPHTLDIVGDGPLAEQVALAASHARHVRVHGRCDRQQVRRVLNGSRALVLPTREENGIADAAPTVLMEAQAMGVPAVAFDVGGTSEMLMDDRFLVPDRSISQLAETLEWLLDVDETALSDLRRSARRWIESERSLIAGAHQTLGVYNGLLGRSR